MITGRDASGNNILFGLSRRNIEEMMAGHPIHIKAGGRPGVLPPEMSVVIMFGETEEAIAEKLKQRPAGAIEVTPPKKLPDHVADVIGPTGDFPNGKMRPDDKGGLRAAVTINNGVIEIHFGAPCTWLALDRPSANAFIQSLTELYDKLPE